MKCCEKLKTLAHEISARSLFSGNETYEDLPTSSLKYLFVACYQGILSQNMSNEPQDRVKSLKEGKVSFFKCINHVRFMQWFSLCKNENSVF